MTGFTTKIAVLLRDELLVWQRLNVTAFLVSGLATVEPETLGQTYVDGGDVEYLPMFRQPVLVFAGGKELMREAHTRGLARGVRMSIFTADLFATGHDAANRAAVRSVPTAELNLVGLAVYGPRNAVDKVVKGASMHG
ncbi:DUF2000 domain-containing protein [Actinoplanes teichomyceticus]|uniref:DUF2000 family protein n=1 Tax=Actinoplanes teichomyceticus TaxID=1867 RepID=A0A561WLV3_ACTTI|nr:DUF2000 domain-containing protein [Actinoplanes teichomyceticus]TWG24823.1 hypothetical protein FHX34_1021386 [Actinoplanes teichomyceticus]GIF15644.1 hypothetical protein Ate01nite_56760 [Actinoplanes teichomyceticus]